MDKQTDLISRLQDEADLCRNDGAGDIAALMNEAVAALEKARAALQKTMPVWGGTCVWHADVKAAIAAIDGLGA